MEGAHEVDTMPVELSTKEPSLQNVYSTPSSSFGSSNGCCLNCPLPRSIRRVREGVVEDEGGGGGRGRGRRSTSGGDDAVANSGSREGGADRLPTELHPMYHCVPPTHSAKTTEHSVGNVESKYEYVLGVVNPASGDMAACQHALRSMRALLGPERVVILTRELFANPLPLQDAIRNFAVRFERQNVNNSSRGFPNGVASVEARGTVVVSGGDGTVSFVMEQLDCVRESLERTTPVSPAPPRGAPPMCFTLPAVAVLAFGTGNDFSQCLGFGGGYSLYNSCFCCDMEHAFTQLFDDAIIAPAVPFDRWIVRFAPLEAIQEQRRNREEEQQTQTNLERTPQAIDPMAQLRSVQWDALDAGGKCLRYNFINYFSVGYDAYVLRKFDTFRRKHPGICGRRWTNKLVYAAYGIKAAFYCPTLHRTIPTVCVPALVQPTAREDECPSSPTTSLLPPLTQLPVPSDSKVLLVTNVDTYAAGTRPWRAERGCGTDPLMTLAPVCINDHKIEVQVLSGVVDMGLLQLGVSAAGKLAQSRELFVFVYCTPEDICQYHDNKGNSNSRVQKRGKIQSLCVQVDGEAVTKIVQPTVAHVVESRSPHIYVRCRNPAVVKQASKEVSSNWGSEELKGNWKSMSMC